MFKFSKDSPRVLGVDRSSSLTEMKNVQVSALSDEELKDIVNVLMT